jgi:nucleotide-binding universal stress UspA family protein
MRRKTRELESAAAGQRLMLDHPTVACALPCAQVPTSPRRKASASSGTHSDLVRRIAAGVDGYGEGRDAAVLGASLARATGAELMLVAIHPDPLVVLPRELGWKAMHTQAEALLRETRDAVAPDARIGVETGWSVPRALERVVAREHGDVLVVGASRRGPVGQVRIGSRTRQLLYDGKCAVAVAPRGLSERPVRELKRIGVGYDSGPEARAALALAGSVARGAGAKLIVRAVLDDRLPMVGWSTARGLARTIWDELLQPELTSLREDTEAAVQASGVAAEIEVLQGAPAEVLIQLSGDADLLVIGSRRWGTAARVLLGTTGEALMHDASCPVLVVPRASE